MTHKERIKRYCFFITGLFVLAFGVALSVKANLGTSPISSLPYVLSLGMPLSIGQFTILMHIIFIGIQIALLRKNFQWIQLMQLPAAVIFGYFTDFALYLIAGFAPANYLQQWIWVLASCVIVALGVSMEVLANVVMLAGEGLAKAIADVTHHEFGKTKVFFDITLVLIAIVCSMLMFRAVAGVREGTLAAALLVGTISRFFTAKLRPFERRVLCEKPAESKQ